MAKKEIPKGRVTIDDIAAEAGVSIASVSRVLNQLDGVGAATRKRILAVIKRLNYYPNLQARGLAANKPNAIGIVITRGSQFAFSNPYYGETLKGIESRTHESDQYLVFSFSGGDRDRNYTQMVHQHLAAGLIVIGNRIGDPWLKEAVREKVPLVLIPGDPAQQGIPSVDFDNVDSAVKSVEHLIELGHRRIGLINGAPHSKYSVDRLKGYETALRKRGLPVRRRFVLPTDFTPESTYHAMKTLLSLSDRPTSVLIVNDHCTLGALKAAREMNCRVPEDISIVGSGDHQLSTMTSPPLTTIREPFYEIGREAADRLLRIIDGNRLSETQLILPAELVVRSSTAPRLDDGTGAAEGPGGETSRVGQSVSSCYPCVRKGVFNGRREPF